MNDAEKEKINIVKHLLRLGAYLQREGGRLLTGCGLNQQQFVVLKEIQEKGPVSPKEICSELLFEKSNVSKILKKLADNKLIRIDVSPQDGRMCLLRTTDKGNGLIERCMLKLNEWNMNWLNILTESEVRKASEVLGRLNDIAK